MTPLVGPGGTLRTSEADIRRLVNLYLKVLKPGAGKSEADYILEEIPGLSVFSTIANGPIRGCFTTVSGATYWAAGDGLFRVSAAGVATRIGTLQTTVGVVEMDENTTQLGVVDGPYGYVVTLADDTFQQITAEGFYGSKTIAVIDGYALFVRPSTGQFYISTFNDMLTFDPLDFATAERVPDNLTAVIADNGQARLFGTLSVEGWFNAGGADFPFSRDTSASSMIGSDSPYTIRMVRNSVVFVGQNKDGNGVVFMATGNSVDRISTHTEEEAIQASTDLTAARAYVYQDGGHLFYCLNAPGMETTLVFDLSTREWHERAEVDSDGGYSPHRATCHTLAFGKHLVGADDGKVYAFDRRVFTNAGDPLSRRRISPHNVDQANAARLFFGPFELIATSGLAPSGEVPVVQMRYSNDGGRTWQGWRERELGRTGEHAKRVRWLSNGSAYDRVWDVNFTGNAPYSILAAKCATGAGSG